MRSSFVLAACLAALRFEVQDAKFSLNKIGVAPEETKKLDDAINAIGFAETQLKSFRIIKQVDDLPETSDKSVKKVKK